MGIIFSCGFGAQVSIYASRNVYLGSTVLNNNKKMAMYIIMNCVQVHLVDVEIFTGIGENSDLPLAIQWMKSQGTTKVKIRQYRKLNLDVFINDLIAINWDIYQLKLDVQDAWDFLYSEFIDVDKHAP